MNSKVPEDAPLVSRLRPAGTLLLGKANLSEWANTCLAAIAWVPPVPVMAPRAEHQPAARGSAKPYCSSREPPSAPAMYGTGER